MTNYMNVFDIRRPEVPTVLYPITEKESRLEKIISKEYECPVCFNYTSPPIMMCVNSHIICFDCWKRCRNCPTCRAYKTLTRAWTLERIHSLISFPCRWEGCHFLGSASYTGVHEHFCKYYPVKCPLGKIHQCSWKGVMGTVQQHLKLEHEKNVFFKSSVFLKAKAFALSVRQEYCIIFVVNERLFKLSWNYNRDISSKVKFGMVSLGNGNPVVIYTYTVTFAKHFPITQNCRKLKIIKSQIKKPPADNYLVDQSNSDLDRVVNHEHEFQELLSFCNDNDLFYQVIVEVSHMTRHNGSGYNPHN